MPHPILIDTNILRRLISKTEISIDLLQLHFLVKNRYVTLMAPEVLKKEWKKHREEERDKIIKSVRGYTKEARMRQTLNDPGLPFFQEDLEEFKETLLSQIDLIDELLTSNAFQFDISDQMILRIFQQQKHGKAPFIDPKKNNQNDATLLFSTLEEIQISGQNELYFVSDNTSEFASKNGTATLIHPDIQEAFPTIRIHYYTDIRDTYKTFDTLSIPRFNTSKSKERNRIENIIDIDKTKSILDQVFQYLEVCFKSLSILPQALFTTHYPFIKSKKTFYFPKPFTLVTDNKEVIDLLTNVRFLDGQITDSSGRFIHSEEDKQKATKIFKTLKRNFIFHVAFKNEKEILLSFPSSSGVCNCPLCLYKGFQWDQLLSYNSDSISDQSIPMGDRLKIAYGFYKIRDFFTAAKLFEILADEAKSKKDILYYIIQFNLYNLGLFIGHSFSYWDHPDIKKYGEKLTEIDLDVIYKECRSHETIKILKWIHNKEFYRTTLIALLENGNKIRDLGQSQSSGYTDSCRKLLESFFCVEAFLNRNSIIYDSFNEFDTLASLFSEGVLASFHLNLQMGGRITHLDDYLVTLLSLYSKSDTLRKFFRRYNLASLSYKGDSLSEYSFVHKLQTFLSSYTRIDDKFNLLESPKNTLIWEDVGNVAGNALTLVSMSNVSGNPINELAIHLLSFFRIAEQLFLHQLIKNIIYFLHKKHEDLSVETLTSFVMLGVENETLRKDDEYIDLLESIFKKKQILLHLNEEQFAIFSDRWLKNNLNPNEVNSIAYPCAFYILCENKAHKHAIKKWVQKQIQINFDSGIFYYACMYDIITPKEPFLQQYFEVVESLAKEERLPRFMPHHYYYTDHRIDEFLNFCFKYKLPIPPSIQTHLVNLSPYYQWIVSPDHFDYQNFDIDWLFHNFTKYIKQYFRKSNTLRKNLQQYIKAHQNSKLERTFIIIYSFDD